MARILLAGLTAIGISLTCGWATAGDGVTAYGGAEYGGDGASGWHNFWHRVHTDFHRNNSWPEPFLTADKMAVRSPYCIMVDNGWKMQNTIGTFLFDAETQQLNQAGDLLVKWIITQAPINRRAVFVLKGDNPESTAVRVQSVQAAVARYGAVCPVLLTDCEPPGWSAAYIDTITQQYSSTIPAPRLPAPQGGGRGGSGGGGGGGGGGGVQ
jgi:hypothetical protein